MTPAPISVERLRELLDKASEWRCTGDVLRCTDGNGCECDLPGNPSPWMELQSAAVNALPALLQQLAEREAEVERLRRECDLRKHAVDRWVPCPDHRDKVGGRCQVCAKEAAERAREEATKDAATERALQRAAGKLPDGWEISVVVENGAGWVTLHDPDGELVEFEDSDRTIAQQVTEATDTAIAAFLAASGGVVAKGGCNRNCDCVGQCKAGRA